MRGSQQFRKLFEAANHEKSVVSKNRGRSKAHHERRNECLCDRYYYYARIQRLKHEDVTHMLQLEFFISPITIIEAVDAMNEHLIKLKKSDTTAKQLAEKWPHLNWKVDGREILN